VPLHDLHELGSVTQTDVYKGEQLAAHLTRTKDGVVFSYTSEYLASDSPQVATSLPKGDIPRLTSAGGVPPFFAGLLPEGRRLVALQRAIKTSIEDELSLLLAIGQDAVGDVRVLPSGEKPIAIDPLVQVIESFEEVKFADLLREFADVDRVGVAGIQEKVSAGRISLPASRAGARYILKLESQDFPHVIANENYFLAVARHSSIKVTEAEIVHDANGHSGLLVKRFDRESSSARATLSLAVEDACQVLDHWPADKYNFTAEKVIEALSIVCASRKLAIREMYTQFCFAWLSGNGDLHSKNISLLSTPDGEWRISPAYDLPSTVPYGDLSLALSIGGKKRGHSRRSLIDFGVRVGLSEKLATKVLDATLESTSNILEELRSGAIPFNQQVTSNLIAELRHRRTTVEK
jgi:serine/threonine-protein kinase HipA